MTTLMARSAVNVMRSGVQEGWKSSGIVKGPGIPAPSGQYRVGCVDLMHQLEGDDRGLLVRLHYPTEATPEAATTSINFLLLNSIDLLLIRVSMTSNPASVLNSV